MLNITKKFYSYADKKFEQKIFNYFYLYFLSLLKNKLNINILQLQIQP